MNTNIKCKNPDHLVKFNLICIGFKKSKVQAMMNPLPQTKRDVISAIQENRDRIKAFGVKKLGLFGSFVREQQRPDSDIDILVEFQPEQKTFDNFIQLSFFLEDMLKQRIELVTTDSLEGRNKHKEK
jgi:predicted nucleotidyltransferase